MRVFNFIMFGIFTLLLIMTAGCFLLIPHYRYTHNMSGKVTDAHSGKPIVEAQITVQFCNDEVFTTKTDEGGSWECVGERTWHASVFVGPFSTTSLLPRGPDTKTWKKIKILADGYEVLVLDRKLKWCESEEVQKISWDLKNLQLEPKRIGNSDACARYEQGVLAEQAKHGAEAFLHYEYAASQGNIQAARALAQCYELGVGCLRSPQKAFDIYVQLHMKGDVEAGVRLGMFYFHGVIVEKSEWWAFQFYQDAAKQGSLLAQILVANCYEYGYWVSQDSKEAFRRYKELYDRGESVTQNLLYVEYTDQQVAYLASMESIALFMARCYHTGTGVEQNLKEAIKYYKLAAKSGDYFAQMRIAGLYEAQKKENKAFVYYAKAAESGLSAASYEEARCYEHGIGVKSNPRYAFEYYEWLANECNLAPAMFALARCYEAGIGTRKSSVLARSYIEKAADADYIPAQMKLAHAYEMGERGYPKDQNLARKYYEKVVKNWRLEFFLRLPEEERARKIDFSFYAEARDLGYSVLEAVQIAKRKLTHN